jgi:SAM-dependent methyltransferase
MVVHGAPQELAAAFGALVALQPVAWTPDGLVCAPRAAPEDTAGVALRDCPLPWSPLAMVPAWPDPPARWLAGWYLRSPGHAAAPAGVRELVQTTGEGFGPGGHPTTAMCLRMLERLPAGQAVDLGCGSGLLAQAWARLGRGPVTGIDLDEAALRQAEVSLAAAGLAGIVRLEHGPVTRMGDRIHGVAVMANMPVAAHESMAACMHAAIPAGVVCSGLRPGDGRRVATMWSAGRLRITAVGRRRGWECWELGR